MPPQATDPGPISDDVCEILFHGDPQRDAAKLAFQLRLGAGVIDDVLADVEHRGGLDRLLPRGPSEDAAAILDALVNGLARRDGCSRLACAFVRRKTDYDLVALNQLLTRAIDLKLIDGVFADVVDGGLYDRMIDLLTSDGTVDGTVLRALAAGRPTYDRDRLNAAAIEGATIGGAPWNLIIVPGYTPIDAKSPIQLKDIPAARGRLDRALGDLAAGRAPRILVTGGAVHPPGTPFNEGLMMRDYLIEKGVAPARILVDPHARHSTTNLRNAGRFMLQLQIKSALVVTGGETPVFDQSFYFGHPSLSSFLSRCEDTLGYAVGDLAQTADARITFRPAPDVTRPNYADPFDW